MSTKRGLVVVAGLVGFWCASARADVDVKFGGQIASDIRYRLGGEEVPPPSPTADGALSVAAAPLAATAFRATRT